MTLAEQRKREASLFDGIYSIIYRPSKYDKAYMILQKGVHLDTMQGELISIFNISFRSKQYKFLEMDKIDADLRFFEHFDVVQNKKGEDHCEGSFDDAFKILENKYKKDK